MVQALKTSRLRKTPTNNRDLCHVFDKMLIFWTEDRFTTLAYARNADGNACHPTAPEAVTWCATGAIYHAIDASQIPMNIAPLLKKNLLDAIDAHCRTSGQSNLATVNDEHGYHAARAILAQVRDRLKAH